MKANPKREAILNAADDDLGIHFIARQFANRIKAAQPNLKFSTDDALEVIGALGMWMIQTGKVVGNEH
jgi:hypothetical protein